MKWTFHPHQRVLRKMVDATQQSIWQIWLGLTIHYSVWNLKAGSSWFVYGVKGPLKPNVMVRVVFTLGPVALCFYVLLHIYSNRHCGFTVSSTSGVIHIMFISDHGSRGHVVATREDLKLAVDSTRARDRESVSAFSSPSLFRLN